MTVQATHRKTPAYTLERCRSTLGKGCSGGPAPLPGQSHLHKIISLSQNQSPGYLGPGGSLQEVVQDTERVNSGAAWSYPICRTSGTSRWHLLLVHNPHHRHTALFGRPGSPSPDNVHVQCLGEAHRSKGCSWEGHCWTTGGWLGKLALDVQLVYILHCRRRSPCY